MQHDDWTLDTSNYRCMECGDVFNTEASIEAHIKKAHAPDNPFQCTQCGKVYKDNWHLNRHLQSHSAPPSNESLIPCPDCNLSFKDSAGLIKHKIDGCKGDQPIGKKDSIITPAGSLAPVPARSTEHLIVSEWNEELLPRPLAPIIRLQRNEPVPARYSCSPIIGIEYYCKICGDVLPRLKFCGHIANHFPDIYLQRTEEPPRQISAHFIHQTGVPLGRTNAGCRSCTVSNSLIQKMKQTLEGLSLGFSQRMSTD